MNKLIFIILIISFHNISSAQNGWVWQNSSLNQNLNDVFFVNSQTGWIVADSTKLLHTTNGGVNWSTQTLPYYSPLKSIFFIDENTGWAAGGYQYIVNSGVVYKTTNGGNNWFIQALGGNLNDIYFLNGNTGFIGFDASGDFVSGGGIFQTTNGGMNWNITDSYSQDYVISSVCFSNGNGFACGYRWDDTGNDTIIILKSTDFGNTWNKKFIKNINGTWGNLLKSICCIGDAVWCAGQDSSILRSTDAGENWQEINVNNPAFINSIFFLDNNTGFIGGRSSSDTSNIMKSTNGGTNWFKLKNNYTNELNAIFFVDENTGWAVGNKYPGADGIILKTITGGLTEVQSFGISFISDYRLEQNYPNPFNPKTIISFEISDNENVSLKVFDVLGNEVISLVNKKLNTGKYNIEFDGSNLSSGIYFYTFLSGNFNETKRMILLK